MIGGKIDSALRGFSGSAKQETATIQLSDIQAASRLLSFSDPDDLPTMSDIIGALGSFRMPAIAIAATVENLLKSDGVQFFKKIKGELIQRYTVR